MTTPNSHPILTRLKLMLTQVRTFLMGLYQGLYLAVYLITRSLQLLVNLLLEKLSSLLRLSKTSLILILMVIAYISILKPLSISLYSQVVALT